MGKSQALAVDPRAISDLRTNESTILSKPAWSISIVILWRKLSLGKLLQRMAHRERESLKTDVLEFLAGRLPVFL